MATIDPAAHAPAGVPSTTSARAGPRIRGDIDTTILLWRRLGALLPPLPEAQDEPPQRQERPREDGGGHGRGGTVEQPAHRVLAEGLVVDEVGPGRGGAEQPRLAPVDGSRREVQRLEAGHDVVVHLVAEPGE